MKWFLILTTLLLCSQLKAADKIYLKDGTMVSGKITYISDFILDLKKTIGDQSYISDEVDYIVLDMKNKTALKMIAEALETEEVFEELKKENTIFGFYFQEEGTGEMYTDINTDTIVSKELVPYHVQEKTFGERIKSLGKRSGAAAIAVMILFLL